MEKKIIFFDVETNGTNATDSVLSISAMKVVYNTENNEMKKLGEFDRFYFRNEGESVNEGAIKVNGLTDEEIEKRRKLSDVEYALTFKEDINNFYEFCDGAEHFIAHNIRFDRQFIPFILKYQFDTMLENTDIVKVPGPYGYKWPKLSECAQYYNVKLEEDQLHNSMYDVIIMARVMFRMLSLDVSKERVERFLKNNISTTMR